MVNVCEWKIVKERNDNPVLMGLYSSISFLRFSLSHFILTFFSLLSIISLYHPVSPRRNIPSFSHSSPFPYFLFILFHVSLSLPPLYRSLSLLLPYLLLSLLLSLYHPFLSPFSVLTLVVINASLITP